VIVAVTGATGFIGRHLTTYLVDRGVEVRAVVRPGSPHVAACGTRVVVAPLDASALAAAFGGADAVVHLAGIVSTVRRQAFVDVNVEGTRAVAAAARRVSARLVHVSSLAAAGPASPAAPRREDDAPDPLTPYGHSKLAGERVVQSMDGLAWVILRPGAVYGPGDRALLPLFRCARRGMLPLVGRRDAAYTFVHVSDVVRAIDAALRTPGAGDVVFVGHPRPVTALEVLQTIRMAVNRRAAVVRIPAAILEIASLAGEVAGRATGRALALSRSRYRELSAEGFVCHVDRLRERLGIVATIDIHEGLTGLASWYRDAGWL
jgi:nucleoside-diphosphate-sugar epimerase